MPVIESPVLEPARRASAHARPPLRAAAGIGTLYDPAAHAAALAAERARLTDRERERDAAAARHDVRLRAVALPLALTLGWLAVNTMPGTMRLLAMWVHEAGHASAAWMAGYVAFPGPWVTPVGNERNPIVTVVVAGWLAYGMQRAWRADRPWWLLASAVTLVTTLLCTLALTQTQAEQFILFAGDGGCFVLGSLLMLTTYAAPEHPVRRDGVCWGLLGIGAIAFMDAFRIWIGPIERMPFGETTNGVTDASLLMEMYGWSIPVIIGRFKQASLACLGGLACAYMVGLARAGRRA